jgi:hypothetical protein
LKFKTALIIIITITGISSSIFIGIYVSINPVIRDDLSSLHNNTFISINQNKSKLNCSTQISSKLPNLTAEQEQLALTLVKNSKIFQENTVGMNFSLASIAPNYSFNPKTCSDFKINAVTVGFKLGNGSSLAIYEDGNITKITGVNIMHRIHD